MRESQTAKKEENLRDQGKQWRPVDTCYIYTEPIACRILLKVQMLNTSWPRNRKQSFVWVSERLLISAKRSSRTQPKISLRTLAETALFGLWLRSVAERYLSFPIETTNMIRPRWRVEINLKLWCNKYSHLPLGSFNYANQSNWFTF